MQNPDKARQSMTAPVRVVPCRASLFCFCFCVFYFNCFFLMVLRAVVLHLHQQGCATWPAFWLVGKNLARWPSEGEIDVIEAVNTDTQVTSTLHTSEGCMQANVSVDMYSGDAVDANLPERSCLGNTVCTHAK